MKFITRFAVIRVKEFGLKKRRSITELALNKQKNVFCFVLFCPKTTSQDCKTLTKGIAFGQLQQMQTIRRRFESRTQSENMQPAARAGKCATGEKRRNTSVPPRSHLILVLLPIG